LDSRLTDSLTYYGTTTVGLVYTDGVVFSTDTRVTMARFVAHKKGKKVYKIDDQNVVDILRYYANIYKLERKMAIPVKATARLASNVFFSSRLFPYITNVLIGGYDNIGASIFNVNLFGALTKEKFVSTGSGSPIAYGILESEYHNDITMEEGMKISIKAVTSAMRRDAMSGDNFDLVIVNKDGYKEIYDEEKKRILNKVYG